MYFAAKTLMLGALMAATFFGSLASLLFYNGQNCVGLACGIACGCFVLLADAAAERAEEELKHQEDSSCQGK